MLSDLSFKFDTKHFNCDVFLGVICILAAFLIFTNLGSVYLWEDEAETALVAKTIWTNGIPKITDGVNYFYQEQGKRVGMGDVWAWTPWLQFYLASASLKLFGWNAWAARLPFAFIGFLGIPLFFRIGKRIFGIQTARLSTLLLVCSVPMLLYVRQCRYYSLVIFATLWAIHALLSMEQARRGSCFSLFLAFFVLFHANYIAWFGLWFSILSFAFFPNTNGRIRKNILSTLFWAALINIPWFLLFKPLHEKARALDVGFVLESLLFSIKSLNHYIAPFLLFILIPPVFRFFSTRDLNIALSGSQKRWILFFLIFMIFSIGFAVLGPARVFRYLVGVIPIAVLLLSLILIRLWNRSRVFGGIIIALVIFTNFFNVAFARGISTIFPTISDRFKEKFDAPFVSYLQELAHPPNGPIYAIVNYLNKRSSPKDLVIVTYGDLPIMFYTGLRVIGGLSFEGLDEAKNADWVIPRKVLVSDEDARVMIYLLDNLTWSRYEKIDLSQTDFPWEYIPEPNAHQFRSLDLNPDWKIQIYRKLKSEEPSRKADPPSLFYVNPMHKSISGGQNFKREVVHYLLWLKEHSPK